MTFDFTVKEFIIGNGTPTLQFYRKGFNLGGSGSQPSWQDIILSGNTALTLVNAKANGLNYLKLFGGTEQVSGTYLDSVTLSGGTEQNGTPTPDAPMDIVCNNGALKANRNLYSTEYHDKVLNQSDGVTANTASGVNVSGMVDCRTIKSFKITTISPLGSFRIFKYGTDNTFISASSTASFGGIVTFEDNVGFFRIQYNYIATGTENILIYNSAYDLNEIYTDGTQEVVTDSVGNTANAEMLLSVGDYKDTQEVLTGTVSRNVGIKVLDGTESWTRYAPVTGGYLFYTENAITDNKLGAIYTDLYCTHAVPGPMGTWALNICRFVINSETGDVAGHKLYFSTSEATTVDGFKTWLATQYANGTPVIIVYPLATATTETVTGQSLSKSPVTQTAGAISGLTITTTESAHTTPTPQRPLPINCNNGVVKVSRNLLDMANTNTHDGYINTSVGSPIGWATSIITKTVVDAINIKVGETYTFSSFNNISGNLILCIVNNGILQQKEGYSITANQRASRSITATADGQLYVQYVVAGQDFQLERGSTATAYRPYGIYTDGTVETVQVTGKNLFDKDANILANSWKINTQKLALERQPNSYTWAIHCEPSTTYTVSHDSQNPNTVLRIAYGTMANLDFTSSTADVSLGLAIEGSISGNYRQATLTTGSDATYIFVQLGATNQATAKTSTQIEQGSTATTYEPYFNGGTATAENLFKVGDYKDVQEVLAGNVTRNVGVKVLDGSENWQLINTPYFSLAKSDITPSTLSGDNFNSICSHFVRAQSGVELPTKVCFYWGNSYLNINIDVSGSTTVAQFKQFLASQYNAGTPVIIVYPLATATTEAVAGQPLTTQAGTNIVEITQASINNLGLEVSYKAVV